MEQGNEKKQCILIVDDSEINRSFLADIIGSEFITLEAENGARAIEMLHRHLQDISLVLLDIVMPEMNGFEVLAYMNQQRWIDKLPVIMISSEITAHYVNRAYKLGAADYLSIPFDAFVVRRRILKALTLCTNQAKLSETITDEIASSEQNNIRLVNILSNVIEFRNGESGQHVQRIRIITEMLLQKLRTKTQKYQLSDDDISLFSTAATLHDIGKIIIPEEILNKPGALTDAEFEIMKTHARMGAAMLESLPAEHNDPLITAACKICRWHHERYDGKGYPDGLVGEQIPIAAQAAALADVYEVLISRRIYKKAYSHKKALEMIMQGQCGAFNPLLLECLAETSEPLRIKLQCQSELHSNQYRLRTMAEKMFHTENLNASLRSLRLLERERTKYHFFAAMSNEIQFEYTITPPVVRISDWGAAKLGVDEIILDPYHNTHLLSILGKENLHDFSAKLQKTTPFDPVIQYECTLQIKDESRWHRIIARSMWTSDEPPQYSGAIGKVLDIHEEHIHIKGLEYQASHDALTGLMNRAFSEKQIKEILQHNEEDNFAVFLIDLDYFKTANDQFGHAFGDRVLQYAAERLRRGVRSGDIIVRVGGDEFLVFLQYQTELTVIADRIFTCLCGTYEDFPISISMGIASTEIAERDYQNLFHCADVALYAAKKKGRGQYCFYENDMQEIFSVISPIDDSDKTDF